MLEENSEHFNFIENLTGIAMVDNLVHVNVQYVTDCQKGVTNLKSQQQ
jgi:hypothetical protein